jgi:hypothetical protein
MNIIQQEMLKAADPLNHFPADTNAGGLVSRNDTRPVPGFPPQLV